MNKNNQDIIKLYGVTLADTGRVRPYGHGMTKIDIEEEKDVYIAYVDYFISDLISLIKNQGLSEQIIKMLKEESNAQLNKTEVK